MHTIRLKHPWVKRFTGSSETQRIDVPEVAGGEERKPPSLPIQAANYTRNFNRPTGLGADSTVSLRITGWHGRIDSLSLNGNTLDRDIPDRSTLDADREPRGGPCVPLEIDITEQLDDHNQLVIGLAPERSTPCRLSGEIELVIDERKSH